MMFDFFESIQPETLEFNTSKAFIDTISSRLNTADTIKSLVIGQSGEGRPIYAFMAGRGKKHIALLAGAHSDEPVGPQMLRLLVHSLCKHHQELNELLNSYTFFIIPHINPDGEARNWKWIKDWPELKAFAAHVFREQPGRDLEFGYPSMRIENEAVSAFLEEFAPYQLYINFHGMAFAEGIMLLIERHWAHKADELKEQFIGLADRFNLPLHDHDRKGEKGFQYLGPGFTTTPEGQAMKKHFLDKGDEDTAAKFHLSSMEYIRSLGGNPLCLVTELPLFLVSAPTIKNSKPGEPEAYNTFKEILPELRRRAVTEEPLDPLLKDFELRTISPATAARIQLQVIKGALEQIQMKH